MSDYSAYIICGTPRSSSTLLCEMLAATGVSGCPNSYFRTQNIDEWAEGWGVPPAASANDAAFDANYLAGMIREGTKDTGVFGLRLMWGSVADAEAQLSRLHGVHPIPELFERAFGKTLYIHLSREDKLAQAISLVRAEQSGLWHLKADGSVFEGVGTPQPNHYDGARIAAVVDELERDDVAWNAFFASHQIAPLRLTYDGVTADPQAALAAVLSALGRDPAAAKDVPVVTRKMGDGVSRDWADQFRREYGCN